MKRRQKVIKKVIPFPSTLEHILEEEEEKEGDEDEEDNIPLS